MDHFIYQNQSLSPDICDEIILKFENEQKNNSIELSNNKHIKTIIDLNNNLENINDNIWFDIINILLLELKTHLDNYCSKFDNKILNIIKEKKMYTENLIIHKFFKNCQFNYNNDHHVDFLNKKKRIFKFLWYLNTIYEGGENEFLGYYKIKPEKGNIVIFPSELFFPNSDNSPISDDKLILCGFVYIDI